MERREREVRGSARGRHKKLAAAASWKYELHGDEACRQCRIKKRQVEDSAGQKFPENFCIKNREGSPDREGYGECKNPQPTLNPSNVAVWNLYLRTYGAANAIGMDGVQIGRHPADVEAVAHAMGIPWDETTLDKFSLIEAKHLEDCHRKYEAEQKKRKK